MAALSKLFVTKEPWLYFIGKCLACIIVMIIGFQAFAANYRITFDPQVERCLPHLFSLVSLNNKDVHKNDMVAFYAKGIEPVIKDNTRMLKLIMAEEGDTVEINKNSEIIINGVVITKGLYYAEVRGLDISQYVGKKTLKKGEYWVMGTHEKSLDSRYWGVMKDEQIIGKAYKII